MAIVKSSLENRLSPRSSWGDLQPVIEQKQEHNNAFSEKIRYLFREIDAGPTGYVRHTVCRVNELNQFAQAFHLNEHVVAAERGTHTVTEAYRGVLDSLRSLFIEQVPDAQNNAADRCLVKAGVYLQPQKNLDQIKSSLTKGFERVIPPLGNLLARRDFAKAQDNYNAVLRRFYAVEQELGYHMKVLDELVETLPVNQDLEVSLASRSHLYELDPVRTRERLHHFTAEMRWLRENPLHLDVPQYFSFAEDLAANVYESHFPQGDGVAVVTSLGDAVNSPRVYWND